MDSPWKNVSISTPECVRTRRHLYLSRCVTVRFTEDESRTIIHVESHRSRGFTWLLALFILKRGTTIRSRLYSEDDGTMFVFVSSSLHNHRSRGRLILPFFLCCNLTLARSPSRRNVWRRVPPAIHPETEWKTERRQTAVA